MQGHDAFINLQFRNNILTTLPVPPYALIISEVAGKVNFEHVIEGITFREESDEQTGFKEMVIIETRDKTKNPTIKVLDSKGIVSKIYNLPVGAHRIASPDHQIF